MPSSGLSYPLGRPTLRRDMKSIQAKLNAVDARPPVLSRKPRSRRDPNDPREQ